MYSRWGWGPVDWVCAKLNDTYKDKPLTAERTNHNLSLFRISTTTSDRYKRGRYGSPASVGRGGEQKDGERRKHRVVPRASGKLYSNREEREGSGQRDVPWYLRRMNYFFHNLFRDRNIKNNQKKFE